MIEKDLPIFQHLKVSIRQQILSLMACHEREKDTAADRLFVPAPLQDQFSSIGDNLPQAIERIIPDIHQNNRSDATGYFSTIFLDFLKSSRLPEIIICQHLRDSDHWSPAKRAREAWCRKYLEHGSVELTQPQLLVSYAAADSILGSGLLTILEFLSSSTGLKSLVSLARETLRQISCRIEVTCMQHAMFAIKKPSILRSPLLAQIILDAVEVKQSFVDEIYELAPIAGLTKEDVSAYVSRRGVLLIAAMSSTHSGRLSLCPSKCPDFPLECEPVEFLPGLFKVDDFVDKLSHWSDEIEVQPCSSS